MTTHLRRQPAPDNTNSPVGGPAPSDATVDLVLTTTQATDVHGRTVAEIEVTHNHVTLWVNSPVGCLARFSGKGFEVLPKKGLTPLAQRAGHTPNDWADFRALVRHHHGLDLPLASPVT